MNNLDLICNTCHKVPLQRTAFLGGPCSGVILSCPGRLLAQPKIPDVEDLEDRIGRIRPLFLFADELRFVQEQNPYTRSFTWDPEAGDLAVGLRPFAIIETLHTHGFWRRMQPTIQEVVRQIPDKYLERCIAFLIVAEPDPIIGHLARPLEFNSGFHVARTQLFEKE